MTEESQDECKVTYTKKYVRYSVLLLGLINLVDVFHSNVDNIVVSVVVDEFLISKGVPENVAYAQYGMAMSLLTIFMLIALAIRYIADRYGRKPALIINVTGMALSSLLCIFAQNFWTYILGVLFGAIFLSADIQMLLINEECPKEKRGIYVAVVRIFGLIGPVLVLLFRFLFMSDSNANWRVLYLLPLTFGLVITVLAIFTLKESSVYLTMKAQRAAHPEMQQVKKESFVQAMKNIRKLKNFRLIIATFIVGVLAVLGGFVYGSYMEPYLSQNFTFNEVTFIWLLRFLAGIPLSAFIGKINDKVGRKAGLYTHLISIPVFLVLCIISVRAGDFILTGIFFGLFIGALWSTPITAGIIIAELTPTKYRGTISVYLLVIAYILIAVATLSFSIMKLWLDFEIIFLIACIPGCLIAIPIVIKWVPETKATDLTKVE